jgi:hypothetical protein
MFPKLTKNKIEILWTKHIKEKMKEYQLSERRLLRILRNPERKEEGIVPGTVAVMQTGGRKHLYEIWLMYQIKISKLKSQNSKFKKIIMISAWKYPGKSSVNKPPIPEEVLENFEKMLEE